MGSSKIDTHKYAQLFFFKKTQKPFNAGSTAIATNAIGHPQAKKENKIPWPDLTPYIKINSKCSWT